MSLHSGKVSKLIFCKRRQITKGALDILKADELIAVNQDPLGIAGDLIWKQGSNEVTAPGSKCANVLTSPEGLVCCRNRQSQTCRVENVEGYLMPKAAVLKADLVWQIWGTGLSGGARAVVLLNRHFDEAPEYDNSSITLHWHHMGWETDMPVRICWPHHLCLTQTSSYMVWP